MGDVVASSRSSVVAAWAFRCNVRTAGDGGPCGTAAAFAAVDQRIVAAGIELHSRIDGAYQDARISFRFGEVSREAIDHGLLLLVERKGWRDRLPPGLMRLRSAPRPDVQFPPRTAGYADPLLGPLASDLKRGLRSSSHRLRRWPDPGAANLRSKVTSRTRYACRSFRGRGSLCTDNCCSGR